MNLLPTIEPPKKRTLYFIGVSTSQSSIMKVFPLWAQAWELDAEIKGIDIALNAAPEVYYSVVKQLKEYPLAMGALVTSHKLDVFKSANELFAEFDEYALLCNEVSCISKKNNSLIGHAKDPITSGLALDNFMPAKHWQNSKGELLIFGAGGAASAIALYHLQQIHQPKKVTIVDINPERLKHIKMLVESIKTSTNCDFLLHEKATENDAILATLPPESLIINATGMGKDLPGSPITDNAQFPEKSYVWEINYRGSLDFLHQVNRQANAKEIVVEDGWVYFLHGWTQVMSEVFAKPLSKDLFDELDKIAKSFR